MTPAFNIFISDIYDRLLADDLKLLKSGIVSVQNWGFENGIILNVRKTTIISFTLKIISINFGYKLCNNLIL
jgi:hypothetical protein